MMGARGVAPDAISYTSAIGAFGRAGAWERALALWREMAANGLEADSKALLSAMRALLGASQWEAALSVFDDAPAQARASPYTSPYLPYVFPTSPYLSPTPPLHLPTSPLYLPAQARASSAVYAAAISACVPTAQPRRATALLSSMQAASPR